MSSTTKPHSAPILDHHLSLDDDELHDTLQDFLHDKEDAPSKNDLFNFPTILGAAMLFVATGYLFQTLGLPIDVSELLIALPIIGGISIGILGLGFFTPERKAFKKWKHQSKLLRRTAKSFNNPSFDAEFELKPKTKTTEFTSFESDKKDSKADSFFHHIPIDSFGMRNVKKLYKSQKNKKLSGVCGGLAKYFNIDATLIRIIFLITFFAGWGSSLLIYLVLMFTMQDEPKSNQKVIKESEL